MNWSRSVPIRPVPGAHDVQMGALVSGDIQLDGFIDADIRVCTNVRKPISAPRNQQLHMLLTIEQVFYMYPLDACE